jgi:hypothetical protein
VHEFVGSIRFRQKWVSPSEKKHQISPGFCADAQKSKMKSIEKHQGTAMGPARSKQRPSQNEVTPRVMRGNGRRPESAGSASITQSLDDTCRKARAKNSLHPELGSCAPNAQKNQGGRASASATMITQNTSCRWPTVVLHSRLLGSDSPGRRVSPQVHPEGGTRLASRFLLLPPPFSGPCGLA